MESILFYVPAGIRSVEVVSSDGRVFPHFVTRKESGFTLSDKVKSDNGTMVFVKDGAKLVVKTNVVRINRIIGEAVHEALRFLAGICNGATSWDGAGFNKLDTRTGKSLASREWLSTSQIFLGARLVCKYRKQLHANGYERLVELANSILLPQK